VDDAETAWEEHSDGGKIPFEGRDIKIEAWVLTYSNWPNYSVTDMRCPASMQACMDAYSAFYTSRHERRELIWYHTLGTAQLNLDFVPGKTQPTVTVSMIQAAMMLVFNTRPTITCAEMAQVLGLSDKALAKYIQSLAGHDKKHPEYQLLHAEQPGGESDKFAPGDILSLNAEGLGSKKIKLKKKYSMPLREMKVDGQAHIDMLAKLQRERVWSIDAMIVRTMKNRGTMKRGLLVMAVVDGLKNLFPAQASFVVGRIQVLAEGTTDEGQILEAVGEDEYTYKA
jgi:cullin-4